MWNLSLMIPLFIPLAHGYFPEIQSVNCTGRTVACIEKTFNLTDTIEPIDFIVSPTCHNCTQPDTCSDDCSCSELAYGSPVDGMAEPLPPHDLFTFPSNNVENCKLVCGRMTLMLGGHAFCLGFDMSVTNCTLLVSNDLSYLFQGTYIFEASGSQAYRVTGQCSSAPQEIGNSSTLAPPTITSPTTTQGACLTTLSALACTCPCDEVLSPYVDQTEEDRRDAIEQKVVQLIKNLTVNKEDLSSTVRRKTSVDDKRVSAMVVGYSLGVAVLTVSIGAIILTDVPLLMIQFSWIFKRILCPQKVN